MTFQEKEERMGKWAAILIGMLWAGLAAAATMPKVEAKEFTLKNGMHFIVFERAALPTVSCVIYFNVGAADEPVGKTGMAHLLEHLMFKGSTDFGTTDWVVERPLFEQANRDTEQWIAELDKIRKAEPAGVLKGSEKAPETPALKALDEGLAALLEKERAYIIKDEFWGTYNRHGGSQQNAFTNYDYTGYFVVIPANKLKLWAVMESDRIRDAKFREFYSERNVIMEEKRMGDETNPEGKMYETLAAMTYPTHPYGRPVVGYWDDLYHMRYADIESFYNTYYRPNNAVAVIVGGVKADEVKALAETYFEPIPRGQVPERHWTDEVPMEGPRQGMVYFDADPQMAMSYRVPQLKHPDYPALDLACAVLGQGESSRLNKRLVLKDKLATFASCWTSDNRDPSDMSFAAMPFKGHTLEEVEKAIREEVTLLRTAGPDEKELQKIKNQYQAGAIYRLDSPVWFATWAAQNYIFYGDWRAGYEFYERVNKVTAKEIQEALAKYVTDENEIKVTLKRKETAR
jgi:predicted Zn-dependent peptidase